METVNLDWGRIVETAFTIWVAYSAYTNFTKQRITRIGFDGFIMGLIGLMVGRDIAEQARKDLRVVRRMGLMMALVALGGIWDLIVFSLGHGWFRHT